MALIFVLLTQLINDTSLELGFEVNRNRRLLPKLRKGKTRFAKQSRILRRIRESEPGWKIRVLIEGEFSGIELDPMVILDFVRLVFRIEEKEEDGTKTNVLCIDGVRENHGSDFLLRHRYFGWIRNVYWNSRPVEPIDRSDSRMAAKLRSVDGSCRYLAPMIIVDKTPNPRRDSSKSYESYQKESPTKNFTFIHHKCNELEDETSKDYPRPLSPLAASGRANGTKNFTPINHKGSPTKNFTPIYQKSNELEDETLEDYPRPLSPWAALGRPNGTTTPQQSRLSREDDHEAPSTNYAVEDNFVHYLPFIFCFMVFLYIKFMIF